MRRAALVLCGGGSRRMGRDKAWLAFGDEVLLQRAVRLVAPAVDEVVVVAAEGQALPALPDEVRVVRDVVADKGPLAGIVTGLETTTADAAYVTACDAPFLKRAVVELLFERLGERDVAVADAAGRLHPLAAVYRRRVRDVARELLDADRLRPVGLYDRVDTVRVDEAALRAVDPELATLDGCNTPEAYEAALARWREQAEGTVTVEFYEGARQLAGTASATVTATTLGAALAAVAERHPDLVPRVVSREGHLAPHWRASLNGKRFVDDPATPLETGDAVVLLSALAGG